MERKVKWKDTTSYSRDDKKRVPRIWNLKINNDISITVHRLIHYPEDTWFLSCTPFFDNYELQEKNIKNAKKVSISLVLKKLKDSLILLKNIKRETKGKVLKEGR